MPLSLQAAARRAIIDAGFAPDLDPAARAQLAALDDDARRRAEAAALREGAEDLRALPWSSIDNPESRDLDQVEVAERSDGDGVRLRIGIADVDALVPRDSPLDRHAYANGTSVYTGVATFPMLPPHVSEELTSLHEGADRLAVVVTLDISGDGAVRACDVRRALVRNHAKLAYDAVGAWLDGGEMPEALRARPELAEQLRLQHEATDRLRDARDRAGALALETIEASPVVRDGVVVSLALTRKSPARELIEDTMIGANVAVAQYLEARRWPGIRRVVHAPARWSRIVTLAARTGHALPPEPDARALQRFLRRRRAADPAGFADLSLAVVKLLGAGEYVVDLPGDPAAGHFGLAVSDYAHATAPNRRYADLVTQRLVKAVLAAAPRPYDDAALAAIATQCTAREDAARKVEREVRKRAAASLLAPRVGERFDAIVTGVKSTGVFVRLVDPPAEGRVVAGEAGMDVGEAVRVRLARVDDELGHLDFEGVGAGVDFGAV